MMVSNRITNIPTQVICSEDIDLDESNILPQGQTFDTILQPQKEPVSIVELGRRLRKCARLGNTEQVHDLMTKGAPFTTDWLGTSALHLAAMNNHLETCEVLLRAGISRDARTKVERTPLHLAAYEGHVAICELLLLNKAEVDPRDMLKMTPLHWAVEKQHDAVIELLLQHGADPTVVSKFDKTPISIAVELNRLDLAHLLQLAARLLSEQTELGETDEATLEATQHLDLELQTQVDVTNVDPMPIIMPECKTELIEDPPISQSIEDSIIDESGTNISNDQIDDEPQILKNASSITSPSQLSTLQLLQAHGITMLPTDEGGLVNNAIQSGRTLVLSEAGKLVLAEGKKMNDSSATTGCGGGDISNKSTAIPIIRPQRKQVVIPNATLRSKKVITLTHEQFMAITKSQGNKPLLKKVSAEAFKKAAETAGVKYSVIPPLKTSNTATAAQPSPPSQQQQSQTPSMKKINDKATSASASVATKEQSQRSPMKVINPAAVSGILSTTGKPKINITALTNQAKELETVKSQLSEALTLIEQLRAQLNEKESENERLLAQIKAMDGEPQENPIID